MIEKTKRDMPLKEHIPLEYIALPNLEGDSRPKAKACLFFLHLVEEPLRDEGDDDDHDDRRNDPDGLHGQKTH